jgi:hypothetical protein
LVRIGHLVVDDLDSLELGVEEASLWRQHEPEVVTQNPEADLPNLVVFVSAENSSKGLCRQTQRVV